MLILTATSSWQRPEKKKSLHLPISTPKPAVSAPQRCVSAAVFPSLWFPLVWSSPVTSSRPPPAGGGASSHCSSGTQVPFFLGWTTASAGPLSPVHHPESAEPEIKSYAAAERAGNVQDPSLESHWRSCTGTHRTSQRPPTPTPSWRKSCFPTLRSF